MLCRAAAAHAAWQGRPDATDADLRRVAPLVLAHRRRRQPLDDPGLSPDELDHAFADPDRPDPPDRPADTHPEPPDPPASASEPPTLPTGPVARPAPGRHSPALGPRGRYVRDRPATADTVAVAALPTAVAAATRRAAGGGPDAGTGPLVVPQDLREAVREERTGSLVVLVVDTSGSMGAHRRLAAAKGAALGLLTDAYQRRNRVAVVACRDERAELVLRPTGSVEIARARLADLATGGTTPIADALDTALAVARDARRDDLEPLLVLITDGRATVGRPDPVAAALDAAARVAAADVPALVIDAEQATPRLGIAADLARALRADCVPLPDLDAERLEAQLRDRVGPVRPG